MNMLRPAVILLWLMSVLLLGSQTQRVAAAGDIPDNSASNSAMRATGSLSTPPQQHVIKKHTTVERAVSVQECRAMRSSALADPNISVDVKATVDRAMDNDCTMRGSIDVSGRPDASTGQLKTVRFRPRLSGNDVVEVQQLWNLGGGVYCAQYHMGQGSYILGVLIWGMEMNVPICFSGYVPGVVNSTAWIGWGIGGPNCWPDTKPGWVASWRPSDGVVNGWCGVSQNGWNIAQPGVNWAVWGYATPWWKNYHGFRFYVDSFGGTNYPVSMW